MKNKRGKIQASIITLSFIVLVLSIYFVSSVEVATYPESLDSSYFWLFSKKKTITGNTIDNPDVIVTVDFDDEVGRVREDFYGVNNHGIWGSEFSWVDTDNNSAMDTLSDYKWHRSALENANIKYLRADMGLEENSLSEGVFDTTTTLRNFANINTRINMVEYAKANDMKVLFIASFMPNWLANKSSYCKSTSDWMTCPPSNYTKWGELVVDFLQTVGCDAETCEVEVWNEPYHSNYWMNNLTYDNIGKATEYVKLYNATYDAVKAVYPDMAVGGLSGFPRDTPNLINTFLSNMTTKMDFVSIHPYTDYSYITSNDLVDDINSLLADCTTYGANCSRIIFSEWGVYNASIINGTATDFDYETETAYGYMSILNYLPANVSLQFYQWAAESKYQSNQDAYPFRWQMVSEPQLDNAYYPSYNVTKDFAHYHAGGNMIVNSSSNNNSIKSVASLNPQGIWHITVINTATNNINVNIDVSSTGVEAIKDLATDIIYPVSNGIVNVGILTEYDVKHYEGIADYEAPAAKVEEEKESSRGSSSGSNSVVSINDLTTSVHNEVVSLKPNTSLVIPTSEIMTTLDTTNPSSESKDEENIYGPVKANEEEIKLYQEGYEDELEGNSYTGALSLAISNKSYLIIAIILLGSIICTAIIISIVYKKKKREADKVKKLMNWVDKARALGYTSEKMKEMLAQYHWDKELVEKVVGS